MQSMGSFGGAMIGAGLLLLIFHSIGWNKLLPYLALFVVIALIPLIFFRKSQMAQTVEKKKIKGVNPDDLLGFFKQKGIAKQIVFLFLYYAGVIGILSMLKPLLVDYGYTTEQIGVMSGVIGASIGCVASLAGGFLVRKLGRHTTRILFAIGILVTAIYFTLLVTVLPINTATLHLGVSMLWGCYGMATIVVYTTAMDCVRPGYEGTDFTMQTVITHLSGMLMAVGSGKFADSFGYGKLFAVEVAIAALSLFYILIAFRKNKTDETRTDF